MDLFFAAVRLSLSQLALIGGVAAVIIVGLSFRSWRNAVKTAFVAVLLEGAIRKWVFPQGQELVYFLKDAILFGAYLRFFILPDMELRKCRLRVPGGMVFGLCSLVALSALHPNIGAILPAVYGVKVYLFYVPLIFMMPYVFRSSQEMVRQLTWYALLAIPICALGFLQWRSDVFSVLNTYAQGVEETGATTFGFGERARITGTFSYITGHTTFVIIFSLLSLVLLSLKEARFKWAVVGLALPMLLANAFMGGSRASVVTIVFIAAGLGIAAMGGRVGSNKHFVFILALGALVAVAGGAYTFRDAWLQWSTRYEVSGSTADIEVRTFGHAGEALAAGAEAGGVFGFGIGATHPAVEALRNRLKLPPPERKAPVYDNELGQVLVELGFVGFTAWYLLRMLGILACWQAYRRSAPGVVRAIALAAFLVGPPFLFMSVVLNHTANMLLCGLTGLALIPYLEPTVSRRYAPARGRGDRARGTGGSVTTSHPPMDAEARPES